LNSVPALSGSLEREIDRRWESAQRKMAAGSAGTLFNGLVFSADVITETLITGHLTEFRRVVAQMDGEDLFDALHLRPLAVCGVLRCRGGIAVGRRHKEAIYQAGMWQLPPAGSVDAGALRADGRMDYVWQVLHELMEEVGIPAHHVRTPKPLCVVEHPGSHVADLGMLIPTDLEPCEVLAAHKAAGNSEYDPIKVVDEASLAAFLLHVGSDLVLPAREFLRRVIPAAFT
jgi:hypothetical protein